ncbi:hypothetical protein IAQ61_003388 [Plenodomus lingam]|uniref:Predicted protein n=1 Tax=Leptosphaeria maculans (strain JN3 / isolate v23.1.3 / race Av1-4-5-6-7-8) TaxID=985895 RepID=E5AED1_LEPMJ|nr:predicted protein [Plenodomus lingam JN3]KAH9875923.1 hypothetical protein IAQ61_003388 [Plenodomus lingam]CBY01570.1 predicted protein [Plenodomus lingam JN3]
MSALTPPSFIDDGLSFNKRTSHGLHPSHICSWLEETSTTSTTSRSTTSAYTGSFVDDGADMLGLARRGGPGFGPIDARFYKQKKRKEGQEGLWNEAVQQAVSGDMQRNLAKMRGLEDVGCARWEGGVAADGKGGRAQETVIVPVPRKWGTFVIRGEDGRVVVVDRMGEFDSRLQGGGEERREGMRWIKAASTVEPVLLRAEEEDRRAKRRERKQGERHRHRRTHRERLSSPSAKPLISIQESEYEDECEASGGEDPVSPTAFFMTGGANGWPSREATTVASPVRSESDVQSPVGGWPSSSSGIQSTVRLEESRDDDRAWAVEEQGHGSEASESFPRPTRSSKTRRRQKHGTDEMSTKSHSTYKTYKAPTIEDASSRSSYNVQGFQKTSWGASGEAASEESWDGYEKNKTVSEVSVAGSGSERSTLSSVASSRHHSGKK